jgi:hypothetical protein
MKASWPRQFHAGLFALLVASLPVCGSPSDPATARRPKQTIGMNLSMLVGWSREWAFVDVFKHSRPWISQQSGGGGPWDTGEEIRLTPEGWPLLNKGQAAATLMCRGLDGHYPGGKYILSFEGRGVVATGLDAPRLVIKSSGSHPVHVKPHNGGIHLRIDQSDPANPVRNIRLTMPGFQNATSPFHPLFLKRLRPFKVIRFMDWQRTNNSKAVRWADRTTPGSIRQSSAQGVAVEYMIKLCNELHAAPWFCMPHLADDDFVRHFAELVRQRLDHDLTIYVEWSNEAWNGIFAQSKWARKEASRRGLALTDVIADEARRDWDIWLDVFGPQRERIVRVAAGQLGDLRIAKGILERLDGAFDAVSCAAYFGVPADLPEATTVEDLLDAASRNIDEVVLPRLLRHARFAEQWQSRPGRPIRLVAYEAGQHIVPIKNLGKGRNDFVPWKQAAWACQTHPKMYDVYRKLLDACRTSGMDLVMAFSNITAQSKWGSWGHLQYQDEPLEKAPKFKALLDAIAFSHSTSQGRIQEAGSKKNGAPVD